MGLLGNESRPVSIFGPSERLFTFHFVALCLHCILSYAQAETRHNEAPTCDPLRISNVNPTSNYNTTNKQHALNSDHIHHVAITALNILSLVFGFCDEPSSQRRYPSTTPSETEQSRCQSKRHATNKSRSSRPFTADIPGWIPQSG